MTENQINRIVAEAEYLQPLLTRVLTLNSMRRMPQAMPLLTTVCEEIAKECKDLTFELDGHPCETN